MVFNWFLDALGSRCFSVSFTSSARINYFPESFKKKTWAEEPEGEHSGESTSWVNTKTQHPHKNLGMLACTHNPRANEAEAGRSLEISGQLALLG